MTPLFGPFVAVTEYVLLFKIMRRKKKIKLARKTSQTNHTEKIYHVKFTSGFVVNMNWFGTPRCLKNAEFRNNFLMEKLLGKLLSV